MTLLLDPSDHPWVSLVSPDDLADMREDLGSGSDPEHCSHGDPVEDAIRNWRYVALDSVPAPTDWEMFRLSDQLWFGFLDEENRAACRSEFAAASSDEKREHLFYGWRSTGAVLSDPVLTTRVRARREG